MGYSIAPHSNPTDPSGWPSDADSNRRNSGRRPAKTLYLGQSTKSKRLHGPSLPNLKNVGGVGRGMTQPCALHDDAIRFLTAQGTSYPALQQARDQGQTSCPQSSQRARQGDGGCPVCTQALNSYAAVLGQGEGLPVEALRRNLDVAADWPRGSECSHSTEPP
jgi:hypothetical protein